MGDVEVVVEDDASEDTGSAEEVIGAIDAHESAKDAADEAEDAEESAEASELAAMESWLAAESSWQASEVAERGVMENANQIAELRAVASDLVTASSNYLQAAQLSHGQAINELPEPDLAEPEPEPDSGSWYTRKLWGR